MYKIEEYQYHIIISWNISIDYKEWCDPHQKRRYYAESQPALYNFISICVIQLKSIIYKSYLL